MEKRLSSAKIQKYKKQNFSQKSLSLSKFNSTETNIKTNQKKDYFALLTQIKNKKNKLGTPPTLFHYFIKKNAQKSINIRLNYLTNRESSLMTENQNFTQKNIIFPKTSFNISFKDKNKNNLFNYKRTETPKVRMNKIFKFEEEKKSIVKNSEKKKYIPMERRDSYKNFVEKKKQNEYMKYNNSNSFYAHKIKTEIYLSYENEKEKKEKKRNDKYLQYMRDKYEAESELKDKVYYPSLELEKLKKKIRSLLLKDYEEKPEAFFNSFVNQINFLQDSYRPPNIKNNLINSKYKNLSGFGQLYGLDCMNRISKNSLNNLSKTKIRKQRENEIKSNFLQKKDKIYQKYFYYKKLSNNDIYNSKEEIEKIIYKDYYIKPEDWDIILKDEKNLDNYEDLEEYKNYFEDKYEKGREVFIISDPKLKKYIFHWFNKEKM